jgi:type IV secretion system protein VirB10
MAIDFEEEAKITETVARPARGRSGKLAPLLLGSAALAILGYAAYVSFGDRKAPASTGTQEEFKTASRSGHLYLDPKAVPEPVDNRLVITPPPVEAEQKVQPVVVAAPPVDDGAARRAAEEAERARKAEELRQARLRSNMLVVDQTQPRTASDSLMGANSSNTTADVGAADNDPNRKIRGRRRRPGRRDRQGDPATTGSMRSFRKARSFAVSSKPRSSPIFPAWSGRSSRPMSIPSTVAASSCRRARC